MTQYSAGIIGLGQIGLMYDFDPKREKPSSHTLAYELNYRVNLVVAADIQAEQREKLAQIAPNAEFYQDMNEMFRECPVDIISICTPAIQHLSDIRSVLQIMRPKVIFCEKPLVSDLRQALLLKEMLTQYQCLVMPNLSRRWNLGMRHIREQILCGLYGNLQKIHIRYTRGILNTGSHLFDLLYWWVGSIEYVQTMNKVETSSENSGEPTFSFHFTIGNHINGFAEGFDDEQYYLFEMDLYFAKGKIEVRNSGDDVFYYQVGEHHLFSGLNSLHLQRHESNLLAEANLGNAVEHIVRVLDGVELPICTADNGLYPLYVAEALLQSYRNEGTIEKVVMPDSIR